MVNVDNTIIIIIIILFILAKQLQLRNDYKENPHIYANAQTIISFSTALNISFSRTLYSPCSSEISRA